MKTLTWADFDPYKPCYSPAESYGEWSGTILDLLRREDIPADDRIWAATRKEILDNRTLRLFACRCVREVWHLLTDKRSRMAVEVAEIYAVGQSTDEELPPQGPPQRPPQGPPQRPPQRPPHVKSKLQL